MQRSVFETYHPWVVFGYLVAVLIVTMSGMHPGMIFTSFAVSFVYSLFLYGKTIWKRSLFVGIPVAVFAMGILPLFRHNGVTPLFYINDMAVTLESIIFGGMMTLLLLAVLQWFYVWNALLGQEKLLYLIGRAMPSVALVISMTLRLLPLMGKRLQDIREGNRGLEGRPAHGIRGGLQDLSVLVSWSLEDSLETSMIMETRGYGIKRRTSFHLYRWRMRDVMWLTGILLLFIAVLIQMSEGFTDWAYFPELVWEKRPVRIGVCMLSFGMLAGIPFFTDMVYRLKRNVGERRFRTEDFSEREIEYLHGIYGKED
ncbi:MAG: hypothetical protein J1E62_01045 [Lachnospiraceae bacterium]|nr:hypothetical protein [Lachnospiraceae bacterium]